MSTPDAAPTIVVGYDGSDASRAALMYAARAAGARGRVFIVHAYDLPPDFLGSPNYDQLLTDRRDSGEALLRELPLNDASLAGPQYEFELIGGDPAESIEAVARVRGADEIVVGARGLGRMRSLIGSVSHQLLHIADRPVVVIPSAAIEREE
jgi:nucleotide-binding universal stress UspA family protein